MVPGLHFCVDDCLRAAVLLNAAALFRAASAACAVPRSACMGACGGCCGWGHGAWREWSLKRKSQSAQDPAVLPAMFIPACLHSCTINTAHMRFSPLQNIYFSPSKIYPICRLHPL